MTLALNICRVQRRNPALDEGVSKSACRDQGAMSHHKVCLCLSPKITASPSFQNSPSYKIYLTSPSSGCSLSRHCSWADVLPPRAPIRLGRSRHFSVEQHRAPGSTPIVSGTTQATCLFSPLLTASSPRANFPMISISCFLITFWALYNPVIIGCCHRNLMFPQSHFKASSSISS